MLDWVRQKVQETMVERRLDDLYRAKDYEISENPK